MILRIGTIFIIHHIFTNQINICSNESEEYLSWFHNWNIVPVCSSTLQALHGWEKKKKKEFIWKFCNYCICYFIYFNEKSVYSLALPEIILIQFNSYREVGFQCQLFFMWFRKDKNAYIPNVRYILLFREYSIFLHIF